MQPNHLPALGARYWSALCLASIFGANMGDLFARNLGLGHVAGLPFLAAALAIVIVVERFDRMRHQIYYWLAIIIVRTAATNFADFAAGDLKLPRIGVMAALTLVLVAALWMSWQFAWRRLAKTDHVLRADLGYWACMFLAGTLGTVIGDFCSHNLHLGDAGAAPLLSPIVALLFLAGRRGLLLWLPIYWLTVVAIRAAGTAVGDLLAGRNLLGLPFSTAVTGILSLRCWWPGSNPRDRNQPWSWLRRAASDLGHTANERFRRSQRPPRMRRIVSSFESRESNMNNLTSEMSLGDLEAVSGGMRNQANDPGFHRTFATSFGPNNGSPLYGTGSFHDQIDNVDGLP